MLVEVLGGVGIGVLLAFVLFAVGGNWLFRTAMETISQSVEKITYAVAHPQTKSVPAQIQNLETEALSADFEVDEDKTPDWMNEEYELGRQG